MRTALIIIDMQAGQFLTGVERHDAAGLIGRLNRLGDQVRVAGGLVIYIQHEGLDPADEYHRSQPAWPLLSELDIRPGDRIIAKTANDAFLGTGLAAELDGAGVEQLILTGCATDFCVDTSVRSALARGYRTIAPSDGHTTADRPHLTAEQVITHHNFIWADMLSPAGPASVIPCADIRL